MDVASIPGITTAIVWIDRADGNASRIASVSTFSCTTFRTSTIGAAEVKLFSEAFADVMEEAHRGTGMMWDFGRTLVKQAMIR